MDKVKRIRFSFWTAFFFTLKNMCSVIVKLCISQEKSINRLGQLVRGLRGEAQGKNKNHLLLVVATIGRELMATFEGD